MLIYRIEDAKGLGPFRGRGSRHYDDNQSIGPHHSCRNHHAPYGEGGDMRRLFDGYGDDDNPDKHMDYHRRYDYKFGFTSIEQLCGWFVCPHGRSSMSTAGYRVAVLEVPTEAVVMGSLQVAYDTLKARPVGTIPLDQLNVQLMLEAV